MAGIGFTASRGMTDKEAAIIEADLTNLQESALRLIKEWVTGGCIDGDAIIGRTMARLRPKDTHVIIVPANRAAVDEWWKDEEFSDHHIELEFMPPGSSYKDRNLRIVESVNGLMAYPLYAEKDERSRRSGTWQTVRLARNVQVPTRIKQLRG